MTELKDWLNSINFDKNDLIRDVDTLGADIDPYSVA